MCFYFQTDNSQKPTQTYTDFSLLLKLKGLRDKREGENHRL